GARGGGRRAVPAVLPPRLPDRAGLHAGDRGRRGARAGRGGARRMTSRGFVRWQRDGWDGLAAAQRIVEPAACLAAAAATPDRASRHARLVRLASDGGTVFVKAFPAPGGWRARRAFRMGRALAAAGFGAPDVVVVGRRGREGLLVTRDVGGVDVATAVAARRDDRAAKR